MEHLPAVPSGKVQGLETVPYVCEKSYDGGPFLTYPIREGKPKIVPDTDNSTGKILFWQYAKYHPIPNKEFEAFCQTWLFFGLINELLGHVCDPVDFVRLDATGDSKTISTSRLTMLVGQWVKRIKDGSCLMTYEHIAECLCLTFATLRTAGKAFDLRLKICIASVGELFEHAANIAFGIKMACGDKCPVIWYLIVDRSVWVEQSERSGWCPSTIEIMTRSPRRLQSLYFFASLPSVSAERHEQCDNDKCVAYQANLNQYSTQHVDRECRCEPLDVDMATLSSVVTTGGLPLLRIHEAENLDQLTVEMVASEPNTCYLALSHVWADGLGNPKANALPRCQLLYLSKLTKRLGVNLGPENLPTELLFWCDTLCCPVTPGEAKNRVLAQMKDIYENASCVLVLDATLRLYEVEAMGAEETCARILASGWIRRLWTLQEGALPAEKGRLWFQFRDKAVNLRPLWHQLLRSYRNDPSRRGLVGVLMERMRTFASFFYRETTGIGSDLNTLDAALHHRAVSVPSDEPLLIGSLLGLDVAKILDGSEETRIHRMWSMMPDSVRGLTMDILFRLGPRLKEPGYRWAPSTMLYHEDSNAILQTMQKGDCQGTPTRQGLEVRLSGYHILFPQPTSELTANWGGVDSSEKMFYMRDDKACWYGVQRRCPSSDGDFLSEEKFGNVMRSYPDLWITQLETDFQARADRDQQTSIALLLRLTHENDGTKYARSYMHIDVGLLSKAECEMFEAAYRSAHKLAGSDSMQRLANMHKINVDKESQEYKAATDAVQTEVDRVVASEENQSATEFARQTSGQDSDVLFTAIMKTIFAGHYATMDPRTPDSQQWCID